MNQHIHTVGGSVIVALCGLERPPVKSIATMLGSDPSKICLVKPAGDSTKPGFLEIVEPKWGQPDSEDFDVYADGVILNQPRTSAVFFTADCPTVLLIGRMKNGQMRVVVIHAGRAATSPSKDAAGNIHNIVTKAHKRLMSGADNVVDVRAYITGAICGHCFPHNLEESRHLVNPFKQFGSYAFINEEKGTLDLIGIIRMQLFQLGIPKDNIEYDGYCTFSSDWLASYRRTPGTTKRNAIVVVLK